MVACWRKRWEGKQKEGCPQGGHVDNRGISGDIRLPWCPAALLMNTAGRFYTQTTAHNIAFDVKCIAKRDYNTHHHVYRRHFIHG